MPKEKVVVVSKNNLEDMKLLSKEVVVCLEIISSFSIDGQYIPPDIPQGRMTSAEANELYIALYNKLLHLNFKNPKKLQKMKPKKLLKIIQPAHSFILGIYRNGTPNTRFKSMYVDESILDDFILEQFAIEFKKSIIQGPNYIIDFTKQYLETMKTIVGYLDNEYHRVKEIPQEKSRVEDPTDITIHATRVPIGFR